MILDCVNLKPNCASPTSFRRAAQLDRFTFIPVGVAPAIAHEDHAQKQRGEGQQELKAFARGLGDDDQVTMALKTLQRL